MQLPSPLVRQSPRALDKGVPSRRAFKRAEVNRSSLAKARTECNKYCGDGTDTWITIKALVLVGTVFCLMTTSELCIKILTTEHQAEGRRVGVVPQVEGGEQEETQRRFSTKGPKPLMHIRMPVPETHGNTAHCKFGFWLR
eukprot:4110589-Amphidinium_carterae.2